MMRTFLNGIVLACALLTTTVLSAQLHPEADGARGSTTGLIMGINATGSFATVDDATVADHGFDGRGRQSGGGMHFTLGYGITPTIGVLLHAGGVELNEDEERTIGGVDLALRYSFAEPARRVVPYLEMAVGGGALEEEFEGGGAEFTGGSLSVATGINVFVTRRLALNADFRYNMGMFTTIARGSQSTTDDVSMGFSTNRVNVGFNWHPMAGR